MGKNYSAPVYDIIEVYGKLAYAEGKVIHYDYNNYHSNYNIHKLKAFDNYIFGLGKYTINIIDIIWRVNYQLKVNTWVDDVNKIGDEIEVFTLRGESFVINLTEITSDVKHPTYIDKKKYKYKNSHKTYTTLCHYNGYLMAGSWNGCITYKEKDYKMHAGTIFDIDYSGDNIITCSTDRSVCILDNNFNTLLQIYDYRNRIYKCGFVNNKVFLEKLLAIYKMEQRIIIAEIKSDLNTGKHFFYTLTECGKLSFYLDETVLQVYKDLDVNITCVCIFENDLYLGYDSGRLRLKELTTRTHVGKADLFGASYDKLVMYHDKHLQGKKININVNKLFVKNTGEVYFSNKNMIYKLTGEGYVFVNKFEEPIVNIYDTLIVLYSTAVATNDCYTEVYEEYKVKNVTSNYENFIGTREGVLWYKNIKFKISDDAITGIRKTGVFYYLSCRDGYVYILCVHQMREILDKNKDQDITIETLPCRRKFISNYFLEGIFKTYEKNKSSPYDDLDTLKNIATFYFANNCLIVACFYSKQSYYLGFKPKRFFLTKKMFYYILGDDLYCFGLTDEKFTISQKFTKSCFKDCCGSGCLCTQKYLHALDNSAVTDRLEIHGISTVKTNCYNAVAGTLEGKIHFCEYIDWLLVENAIIDVQERVIDLCFYREKDLIHIAYALGNNTVHFEKYDYHNKYKLRLKKMITAPCPYTSLYFCEEQKLYMGRVDGLIEIRSKNFEDLKLSCKVSTMPIHKVLYLRSMKTIICIGDDHKLVLVGENGATKVLSYHTGPIIDFVMMHENIIATLGSDRKLNFIHLPSYDVCYTKNVFMYKPVSMVRTSNRFYIYGEGMEMFGLPYIMEGKYASKDLQIKRCNW